MLNIYRIYSIQISVLTIPLSSLSEGSLSASATGKPLVSSPESLTSARKSHPVNRLNSCLAISLNIYHTLIKVRGVAASGSKTNPVGQFLGNHRIKILCLIMIITLDF